MPPGARTRVVVLTLGDLVERVLRGQVRIPQVDRPAAWDVPGLLDSVGKGYPIGNILVWQRPAPAGAVTVGPLRFEVPEAGDAWWVIDGRRRITTLATALAAPDQFERSYRRDSDNNFSQTALREYKVPLYVVDGPEATVREMYERLNWTDSERELDVFDLLRALLDQPPVTMDDLIATSHLLGFGDMTNLLVASVLSSHDPVPRFPAFRRDEVAASAPPEIFTATAEGLRVAVTFLRDRAGIPHVALLPQHWVLPILVRFGVLFGSPDPESGELLNRWVWRSVYQETYPDPPGRFIEAVHTDASASVRRLLSLLAEQGGQWSPALWAASVNKVPHGPVNVLGMLAANPRIIAENHFLAGDPVDVTTLLYHQDNPLDEIIPGPPVDLQLAKCVVHPLAGKGAILKALTSRSVPPEILHSHYLDLRDVDLLRKKRFEEFLQRRAARLRTEITGFVEQRAKWSFRDQPIGRLFDDEDLADAR